MSTAPHWHLLPFSSLSSAQLYAIMQLRVAVFVVEQQCPYQELDGKDLDAEVLHLFAENQVKFLLMRAFYRPS